MTKDNGQALGLRATCPLSLTVVILGDHDFRSAFSEQCDHEACDEGVYAPTPNTGFVAAASNCQIPWI